MRLSKISSNRSEDNLSLPADSLCKPKVEQLDDPPVANRQWTLKRKAFSFSSSLGTATEKLSQHAEALQAWRCESLCFLSSNSGTVPRKGETFLLWRSLWARRRFLFVELNFYSITNHVSLQPVGSTESDLQFPFSRCYRLFRNCFH